MKKPILPLWFENPIKDLLEKTYTLEKSLDIENSIKDIFKEIKSLRDMYEYRVKLKFLKKTDAFNIRNRFLEIEYLIQNCYQKEIENINNKQNINSNNS